MTDVAELKATLELDDGDFQSKIEEDKSRAEDLRDVLAELSSLSLTIDTGDIASQFEDAKSSAEDFKSTAQEVAFTELSGDSSGYVGACGEADSATTALEGDVESLKDMMATVFEVIEVGAAIAALGTVGEAVDDLIGKFGELQYASTAASLKAGPGMSATVTPEVQALADQLAVQMGRPSSEIATTLGTLMGWGVSPENLDATSLMPIMNLGMLPGVGMSNAANITALATKNFQGTNFQSVSDMVARTLEGSNINAGNLEGALSKGSLAANTGGIDLPTLLSMYRQENVQRGFDPSQINMALTQATSKLSEPVESTTKLNSKTGELDTTYKGFAKTLLDGGGSLDTISDKSDTFLQKLVKLDQEGADFTKIFGPGRTSQILKDIADNAQGIENFSNVLKTSQGVATEYATTMEATWPEAMNRVNSAIGSIEEHIGSMLAGPATELANWLSGPGYEAINKFLSALGTGDQTKIDAALKVLMSDLQTLYGELSKTQGFVMLENAGIMAFNAVADAAYNAANAIGSSIVGAINAVIDAFANLVEAAGRSLSAATGGLTDLIGLTKGGGGTSSTPTTYSSIPSQNQGNTGQYVVREMDMGNTPNWVIWDTVAGRPVNNYNQIPSEQNAYNILANSGFNTPGYQARLISGNSDVYNPGNIANATGLYTPPPALTDTQIAALKYGPTGAGSAAAMDWSSNGPIGNAAQGTAWWQSGGALDKLVEGIPGGGYFTGKDDIVKAIENIPAGVSQSFKDSKTWEENSLADFQSLSKTLPQTAGGTLDISKMIGDTYSEIDAGSTAQKDAAQLAENSFVSIADNSKKSETSAASTKDMFTEAADKIRDLKLTWTPLTREEMPLATLADDSQDAAKGLDILNQGLFETTDAAFKYTDAQIAAGNAMADATSKLVAGCTYLTGTEFMEPDQFRAAAEGLGTLYQQSFVGPTSLYAAWNAQQPTSAFGKPATAELGIDYTKAKQDVVDLSTLAVTKQTMPIQLGGTAKEDLNNLTDTATKGSDMPIELLGVDAARSIIADLTKPETKIITIVTQNAGGGGGAGAGFSGVNLNSGYFSSVGNSWASQNVAFPTSVQYGATSIPYMAEGGHVTRPTLAMVGESGPETIIPDSKMAGRGGPISVTYAPTINGAGLSLEQLQSVLSQDHANFMQEIEQKVSNATWR